MENITVEISNNLSFCNNTYNFYSTDKFIYIIFNKIPYCNLVSKFINVIINNFIEIPINVNDLKNGINKFKKPFCTVPVISLYESKVINKWNLVIYDNSFESLPIAEFNIIVNIYQDYLTRKSILLSDFYCGIFFECLV